jgi:simple sugar transport system permease protein
MPASAPLPRWADLVLLPLLNLAAALLLSGAVVAVLGQNPWAAFRLLASGAFGSQENLGYTLYYATNYSFTALAVCVAFRAGLFNIGGEGQAYLGGLGSGLVCLWLGPSQPFWVILPLAALAGMLFGAAWAAIPAWLQARRGSHIVITTIMFNFLGSALMTYLLVNVLIEPGQQSPQTREFSASALLPSAQELLGKLGIPFAASPLNLSFLFALAAAALVWVLLWRTPWGYALRIAGASPAAADYAGISRSSVIIGAMLLSGALAGCLGLNELMGAQRRILLDFPSGAGFVGIAVALMGRRHPAGILAAALLFGALQQGGSQLSFDMPAINRDLVVVIQGLVILLCGALDSLFRNPLAWLLRR